MDWPFDFGEWLSRPRVLRADLARSPVGVAAVLLAEPVLAPLGAGAFANWFHRNKPVIGPGSTVLHEVLGDSGKELSSRFVAVTMQDERVIEGWMGSYSTDSTERFFSLAAPIYVTAADGAESETASDEVIVHLDSVVDIGVVTHDGSAQDETESTGSAPQNR